MEAAWSVEDAERTGINQNSELPQFTLEDKSIVILIIVPWG